MTTGALLRDARRRAGLSQSQVADRAGTSQPVISMYEHDRREPSIATLTRLVNATGARLRLSIEAAASAEPLPPPRSDKEHGDRLVELLRLADAVGTRRHGRLVAPRLVSR